MDSTSDIDSLIDIFKSAERVVALTGSGISAESGIPTFRGEEGLWKQYRAEELATPEAFARDPELLWEWYDWRRQIIGTKEFNAGHRVLAGWESLFPDFLLITQNIDGLHQKAGSSAVLELHGNIWKMRCIREGTVSEDLEFPLKSRPPRCSDCGELLRPHVVWFGESLDSEILNRSFLFSSTCEVIFVIGTSAVVQPAASLPLAASDAGATVVEINPDTTPLTPLADYSFRGKAGDILPLLDNRLRQVMDQEKSA